MSYCHTRDLIPGGIDDYVVHVYLVATPAQLNNMDCGLTVRKITLYWMLQEMCRADMVLLWQLVHFYQSVGS